MKKVKILTVIFFIVITSCTIKKRLYQSGYAVQWAHNANFKKSNSEQKNFISPELQKKNSTVLASADKSKFTFSDINEFSLNEPIENESNNIIPTKKKKVFDKENFRLFKRILISPASAEDILKEKNGSDKKMNSTLRVGLWMIGICLLLFGTELILSSRPGALDENESGCYLVLAFLFTAIFLLAGIIVAIVGLAIS